MSRRDSRGDITSFTRVDTQPQIDFFIRTLDAANAFPDARSIKQIMIKRLELRPGSSLLDLGCGTGDDVAELAAILGATGTVVGADVSTAMIAEANRRHGHLSPAVRFMEADAECLDLSGVTFDRCRAERLLMHVPHPQRALAEMARVLRPAGVWSCSISTGTRCTPTARTRRPHVACFIALATVSGTDGSAARFRGFFARLVSRT
jgi:ubiquinone/menaquinone biosynthesis C-methylase UbiE